MFVFFTNFIYTQTPGIIYKRAQGLLGQKVLDPNNDGFIALTPSGFSGTDYGTASELKMIPLPVFEIEPIGDLSTGSSGGHTDIASAGTNQSCYILKRSVAGIDYLVVRFRLGGASTASKGYSLLIDSDSNFGTALSANNLGFDREIVFETGTNGRVAIYKHELNNAGVLLASFDVHAYAQRSVAFSAVGGNADYFYDFFVPLAAIDASNLVRFTAVTVTSAGSGVLGTISDFNGVDDAKYNNNSLLLQQLLISSFPAVLFSDLDENFNPTSWLVKSATPTVNNGITPTTTSISGTSTEANGAVITVYKNGVSIGTATFNNNTWTLTGITSLAVGDLITATALATGKSVSDVSNVSIVYQAKSCFTSEPTNIVRGNQQTITGTWSQAGLTPNGSNVQILLYEQNPTTLEVLPRNLSTFVQSDGGWSLQITPENNPQFNDKSYLFKARIVAENCLSGYSVVSAKTNGAGTVTTAPTVNTNPIYQSISSQSINVTNNATYAATLILYSNGQEILRTTSTIAAGGNHNFSVAGLQEADVITARAQSPTVDYWLSNISNSVTVQLNPITQQTLAPVITGTYTAGSGKTIIGASTEPAGTEINVYKANTSLLGTTTVTAFGTWQVTGLTLVLNDVLTATAKANSKLLSAASNAVVVTAAPPANPTITGDYSVESNTITGTGGNTAVQLYADGSLLGVATPSGGNWSLSGINPSELYRGLELTAKNLVSGTLSAPSNTKVVTGVGGFCITLADGSPIPNPINSGETLNIKITAIQGTTCPGTPYTNFTGTVNLSGTGFISPSGTTANFTAGVLTTTITFGGTGNTTLTAINTADPSATGAASTVVQNPALWVGTTSTDFNTASNWSNGYVPGPGAVVTFAPNVMNDLHLDTDRLIGDLDFNNGSHTYKLVVGAHTLEIRGTINNSTIGKSITTIGASNLTLSGYGASNPVYFSTGSTINELTLNKTNAGSITIGSPIRILSFLNVLQGSLNADGKITLASSVLKTAVVPSVGGSITGNVTVENYIPAKRAYRFLTSSVTSSSSINANWQEGAWNSTTATNINPNPGFGTHITGNGQNGLDATQTTNYSMYTYNNTTLAWQSVGNTSTNALSAGTAYRILIRGDRSINLNTNTPLPIPTTLRATGTLVVGDFEIVASTLNQDPNTFSFIGNPYQAKVNMKEVLKGSGFNPQVWYWNPTQGTRGAYVPVDFSSTTDLIGVPGAGNTRLVMPGASFFVKKQGTTSSSIIFKESHKVSETSDATLFRQNQSNMSVALDKISVSLHENNNVLPSNNIVDGVLMVFSENFDSQFNDDDMIKFSNLDEDLAIYHGSNRLSIDKRGMPLTTEVIDLGITKFRYTNYKFKINLEDYNGIVPYLYDQYLNTYTSLTPGSTTDYTFSIDNQNAATTSTNRFKMVFQNTLLNTTDFNNQIILYPNPGNINSGFYLQGISDAAVSLHNVIGQSIPVETSNNGTNTIVKPTVSLSRGIYFINITKEENTIQLKWIVE